MSRHRFVWIAVACLCLGLIVNVAPAAAARDRTPPTTPGDLRITASTDTSVSLAWNKSTDASSFWYCVQQNGGGCLRVNPPQTTFTRSKLLPDQTHTFAVYAIDAAGNRSANSNTVSHRTPPDATSPSPPPTLTLTALTPTRLSVSWPAPADNLSQVWTSLFVNGSPYFVDRLGPPNATIGGLIAATSYELKVTHRDAFGNVAEGDVLTVTTPAATDTQPPSAPSNLRVGSDSYPPDIVLRWDQSTDESDPQSQIGYEAFLNGVPGGAVIGVGSAFFSCLAVGPTEIVLVAFDTTGNRSGPSNTVTFDCTEA